MFKFLKRLVAAPPQPAPAVQRSRSRPRTNSASRSRDAALGAPVPVPEIVEGNEETDWALWEDSMTALDSQKQGLGPRASSYDTLSPSSQFDDADPFSSVRKRDR